MQQLVAALRGSSASSDNPVEFALASIVTKSNINMVLRALVTQQPFITLATTLDSRGGQIVCDAFLLGLSPEHTVWMFGGPFTEEQWWLPPSLSPSQNSPTAQNASTKYYDSSNCSMSDILTALNGSFTVDHRVIINVADDSLVVDKEQERQRQRVDKMKNSDLQQMFRDGARRAHATPPIKGTFMMYDTVWAMALALQRVNDRMKQEKVSLTATTDVSYFTPEYKKFSSTLQDELRKLSFYGATVSRGKWSTTG